MGLSRFQVVVVCISSTMKLLLPCLLLMFAVTLTFQANYRYGNRYGRNRHGLNYGGYSNEAEDRYGGGGYGRRGGSYYIRMIPSRRAYNPFGFNNPGLAYSPHYSYAKSGYYNYLNKLVSGSLYLRGHKRRSTYEDHDEDDYYD